MHKRYVNHCTIELTISPCGPILIKSGKEGADPTKPDMEFVETFHQQGESIYLPGSSLKGAIRAHAERIVRTVGKDKRPQNDDQLWASNPLNLNEYEYLKKVKQTEKIYRISSFTDQMFGHTFLASRIRIEDAYPDPNQKIKLEERNGVAIDRIFGSVAVGPFNYQVCTAGAFHTKIHIKNFTLPQLGLLGLVLRDLDQGWFGLGFAKSRGMGMVDVTLNSATVQYPGCILDENGFIVLLGQQKSWNPTTLLGAGCFLNDGERAKYGFPENDQRETLVRAEQMDFGFGVQMSWQGEEQVRDLFIKSVPAWRSKVESASK